VIVDARCMLAENNTDTTSSREFELLARGSHSCHTICNEYPDLGGLWPLSHHAQPSLVDSVRDPGSGRGGWVGWCGR
jgi:hypothetical protein